MSNPILCELCLESATVRRYFGGGAAVCLCDRHWTPETHECATCRHRAHPEDQPPCPVCLRIGDCTMWELCDELKEGAAK